MNLQDICSRAQGVVEGDVTDEEVEYARGILRERAGDISAALYVVGYCGSSSDAALLESYVSGPEKDVLGGLAFTALCRYLGLIGRYRLQIRNLIMSPTDIGFTQSRMTAIHLAVDYFRSASDNQLGCRLVDIYCDPEDDCCRSARSSLVAILGLRDDLKYPFGLRLNVEDSALNDPDRGYIVSTARHRFRCNVRVQ